MAKEKFERTKPHVNVAVIVKLQQLGLTYCGAQQVAAGQIVTNPNDRRLIAVIAERSVKDKGAFEIISWNLEAD